MAPLAILDDERERERPEVVSVSQTLSSLRVGVGIGMTQTSWPGREGWNEGMGWQQNQYRGLLFGLWSELSRFLVSALRATNS